MPQWTRFKDPVIGQEMVKVLQQKLAATVEQVGHRLRFMEICGTHTAVISRYGLRGLCADYLDLYSGPGCPVCVTDYSDMDKIIEYAKQPDVILAVFGDMIRVPGSYSTLMKEKAEGRDVRIVYSPLDSLKIAEDNPEKLIVFVAIGFETTMPAIASGLQRAILKGLNNYTILCLNKATPPAVMTLLPGLRENYDGFLVPGHVSVVTGVKPWEFFSEEEKLPAVVTGFEPIDLVSALIFLVDHIGQKTKVANYYARTVKYEGNVHALEIMDKFFEPCDAMWRGLGEIPVSGYQLREDYSQYDAEKRLPVALPPVKKPAGCRCGELLMGKIIPFDCPLFGKVCTPLNPIGPCMVSGEGSCATYYRYERKE